MNVETPRLGIAPEPDIDLAARLLEELRERTGTSEGITRASYGMGEQIAHDIVRREAHRLAMTSETDAGCNLYLTLEGARPGPAIFVGSHLDSVPMGGNFDGAAGVLAGLAVAAGYRRAGVVPPRDLTVAAFRAEESTWFGASYIGSRAAFGRLDGSELDGVLRAGDLIRLGAAIEAAGGDIAAIRRGKAHLHAGRVAAFIETHIEQGPALVEHGHAVGIVTGIRGSFRYRQARCIGTYAHSGATPRDSRSDAALAVALLVGRLDEIWIGLAAKGHDLVVTFGQMSTDPAEAAFSKVAGRVDFSLDVRSQSTETLALVRAEVARLVAKLETERRVRFDLGTETGSRPAMMDGAIVASLQDLAAARDLATLTMPSGAGHDAAVFAAQGIPTGMLFVRNRNGSHNPAEAMEIADFAQACRLLSDFCLRDPGHPA